MSDGNLSTRVADFDWTSAFTQFLSLVIQKGGVMERKKMERAELIEQIVQEAGELTLEAFGHDAFSQTFYVHCQQVVGFLDHPEENS